MNVYEEGLARRFKDAGYEVFTGGWPDLLVEKDGKFVAYEVKGPGDILRPNQIRMLNALCSAGMEVEVIDEQALPFLKPNIRKRNGRIWNGLHKHKP